MADNTNHQFDTEYIYNLLSPYLDNEVTEEERLLVEQAISQSPDLRRELETLRQTVQLMSRLPKISAPRPFTLSEADIAPETPSAQPSRRIFGLPLWISGLVGVAAMLLCVVVMWSNSLLSGQNTPASEVAMSSDRAAPITEEAAGMAAEEEMIESAPVEEEALMGEAEKATPSPESTILQTQEELPRYEAEEEVAESAEDAEKTEIQAVPMPSATMMMTPETLSTGIFPAEPPPLTASKQVIETESASSDSASFASFSIYNQKLKLEPGFIQLSGNIGLPSETTLTADLQRDDRLFNEWAIPTTLQSEVQESGQFTFTIQAKSDRPDQNLLASEPANYRIEIKPQGIEATFPPILFDTFGEDDGAGSYIPLPLSFPSPTFTLTPTSAEVSEANNPIGWLSLIGIIIIVISVIFWFMRQK